MGLPYSDFLAANEEMYFSCEIKDVPLVITKHVKS